MVKKQLDLKKRAWLPITARGVSQQYLFAGQYSAFQYRGRGFTGYLPVQFMYLWNP